MNKLSHRANLKLRDGGRDRQVVRELTESEIGQVAGGVSCSWFEKEFGWITHAGYPPKA